MRVLVVCICTSYFHNSFDASLCLGTLLCSCFSSFCPIRYIVKQIIAQSVDVMANTTIGRGSCSSPISGAIIAINLEQRLLDANTKDICLELNCHTINKKAK